MWGEYLLKLLTNKNYWYASCIAKRSQIFKGFSQLLTIRKCCTKKTNFFYCGRNYDILSLKYPSFQNPKYKILSISNLVHTFGNPSNFIYFFPLKYTLDLFAAALHVQKCIKAKLDFDPQLLSVIVYVSIKSLFTIETRPAWAGFKTAEEGRANTPFGVGGPRD